MYFPLFVDLSEIEILVIGAGHIAMRRIHSLCGFCGHITVVAPDIPKEMQTSDFMPESEYGNNRAGRPADTWILSAADTEITVVKRIFEDSDLGGKDLVLAATDNAGVNRHIYELCHEQGIPVNVCTDASLCDFQFPSIVESGSVVTGINASGRDHHLVKATRKRIEALVCDENFKSRYEKK